MSGRVPRISPPPLTEAELARVSARERRALRMRYGLRGGRCHGYREIGQAIGVSESYAQVIVKGALYTIQAKRSLVDAFAGGARMAREERSGPPLPGPFQRGGFARRSPYRRRKPEEITAEGYLVMGWNWTAAGQRWGVLV